MLLSTMYHEGGPIGSHVTQAPSNWASSTRPEAEAVNELQAYRAERSISERLGLDPTEIRVIDSNISSKLAITVARRTNLRSPKVTTPCSIAN